MPTLPEGNWPEYQKLVLFELERHNRIIEALHQDISSFKAQLASRNELAELRNDHVMFKERVASEMSALKIKSSSWGAVAGALAALVPIIMMVMFQMLTRKP